MGSDGSLISSTGDRSESQYIDIFPLVLMGSPVETHSAQSNTGFERLTSLQNSSLSLFTVHVKRKYAQAPILKCYYHIIFSQHNKQES